PRLSRSDLQHRYRKYWKPVVRRKGGGPRFSPHRAGLVKPAAFIARARTENTFEASCPFAGTTAKTGSFFFICDNLEGETLTFITRVEVFTATLPSGSRAMEPK